MKYSKDEREMILQRLSILMAVLFGGFTGISTGIRYDLVPGLRIINTSNLTIVNMTNSPGEYRILNNGTAGVDLLSDSSTFALAYFDPNKTGDFYLSLMMQVGFSPGKGSAAAVPVWIANGNQSTVDGATLMLTQHHQKFILLDGTAQGSLTWNSGAVGIAGIEFSESGNMIFYDSSGKSLWESFDHPGDTLAFNQTLREGQRLTSTVENPSNGARFLGGNYMGTLGQSGFSLSISSEPYVSWNGCQNGALAFTGSALGLSCAGSGSKPVEIVRSETKLSFPFAKLKPDGDFGIYSFQSGDWIQVSSFSDGDSCKLPNSCGPYGICESRGKCRCIQTPGKGNESYSSSNGDIPCSLSSLLGLPQPQQCENEFYNHHFMNVTGFGYFSTRSISPNSRGTLESCATSCLSNCSCLALFYNSQSRECFQLESVIGSLRPDPSFTALLKFQNANPVYGPIPVARQKESNTNIGQIAAGVSAAAAVLLLALLLLIIYRNRRNKKRSSEIDSVLSNVRGLPQRFSFSALDAATKGFSRKLGTGGFGSVYEGVLSDRRHVAVKKLEGNGNQGARQFIAEVATIGSISHVNVVRLVGFCLEEDQRMLVYEFMPNGSLDRWLFPSRDIGDGNRTPERSTLSWDRRMEIALATARGLAYLHEECSEPIIHLDIKPQNILLDERFVAKVADFGMSKLLNDRDVSQVITCVRGTPGYLAPEWLLHSVATKKCDVYSYGMVLLEIIGGRKNLEVSRMNTDLAWYFPAWVVNEARQGNLMGVVDEKIRDTTSEKQAMKMIRIALWCIQENAALRPGMDDIVQMIEGHREVGEPPLSFHFAVQTEAIVDITASRESVSMAYVTPPSFSYSSLIR